MVDKELTIDFCQLFDIIIDTSQLSNLELLGQKYLKHQENYMVDTFLKNLEEPSCYSALERSNNNPKTNLKGSLFEFKKLKCYCTEE